MFYNVSLEVKNLKNIYEGFDKFLQPIEINDYKCDNCNKKCDVEKRSFVSECPNVMIIHLQRIIFDLDQLMNVKINSRYEIPFNINMKKNTKAYFDFEKKQNNEKDQGGKNDSKIDDMETTMNETGISDSKDFGMTKPAETEIKEDLKSPLKKDQNEENVDQEPPEELREDEYYEYNLVGVVCHYGSADVGHYYSYINVNRNDPNKPNIDKDKWLEFNDSRITDFDLKNFEECCFGSGNGNDNDMEFDILTNKFEKLNNNKSAYILVYEKKQKEELKFTFDKDNLDEKQHIIDNLLKKESLDPEISDPNNNSMELTVKFDDMKKYMPPKYISEIIEDNFKFQMEQQIYTKEF